MRRVAPTEAVGRHRRDGALSGLTKPALDDAEDCEGWEKRIHIGRGSQYCSEYQAELKKRGRQLLCDGRDILQNIEIRADLADHLPDKDRGKLTIGRPE